MKYMGSQGPEEALSLIVPIWVPRVDPIPQYAPIILHLFKARLKHPSWNAFVGSETLFGQAHKVFVQVMGYICGDQGILNPQRQHCHMALNGSVQGDIRALQLIIYGKRLPPAVFR